MYVYFEQRKTQQFGKSSEIGIHLKKPTAVELVTALEQALHQGFKHVFIYDSSCTIVDTADKLMAETDLLIGWNSFCQTVDAFRLDFEPIELQSVKG